MAGTARNMYRGVDGHQSFINMSIRARGTHSHLRASERERTTDEARETNKDPIVLSIELLTPVVWLLMWKDKIVYGIIVFGLLLEKLISCIFILLVVGN